MNINNNFPSQKYSIREGFINFIIIHYTELSFQDALDRLRDPIVKVSAHYLIKSNGEIFNLVEDQHTAWHAGLSYWRGFEKLNEYSIGIELDNIGIVPFPLAQMEAYVGLCQQLANAYNILPSNIIGHSDIAPERKIDPGIFFDWSYLAKHNLGIWGNNNISESPINSEGIFRFEDTNPEIVDLQNSFKKLGYKIEITGAFDLQTKVV